MTPVRDSKRPAISRARALRRDATVAEQRLWQRLRNRQLAGLKFRRQCPIGRYVVDFVCFEAGLVVEVDGGQHADRRAADEVRERTLQAAGFRVLRVWNNEVLENMEGVLAVIEAACGGPDRNG